MSSVKLTYKDKEYFLPILESKDGYNAIDLSHLYSQTHLYAYDPLLHNIALTQSKITCINTESSKLYYRGYDVEDLVEDSSFIEVSYLLINGKLPTQEEHKIFSRSLSKHSMIHEAMRHFFNGFPTGSNPLAILATMVTAFSSYYPLSYEEHFSEGIDIKTRLLSKVRTLAAWAYKKSIGQPIIYPKDEYSYCSNFLNMMFALPTNKYIVRDEHKNLLDKVLILYSDHELSVATSTVRLLGSTGANLFVCINAGISALWGSREFLNETETLNILQTLCQNQMPPSEYFKDYINGKKEWSSSAFGHKKYSGIDARAKIARKVLHKYIETFPEILKDSSSHLAKTLKTALEIEEYVIHHDFFNKNGLLPNLDFYSSLLFLIIGIPENMFNVVRVIGKIAGWLAHWEEQRNSGIYKDSFIRPQQIYVGSSIRKFTPIENRE